MHYDLFLHSQSLCIEKKKKKNLTEINKSENIFLFLIFFITFYVQVNIIKNKSILSFYLFYRYKNRIIIEYSISQLIEKSIILYDPYSTNIRSTF